jgi:hypothetical protein
MGDLGRYEVFLAQHKSSRGDDVQSAPRRMTNEALVMTEQTNEERPDESMEAGTNREASPELLHTITQTLQERLRQDLIKIGVEKSIVESCPDQQVVGLWVYVTARRDVAIKVILLILIPTLLLLLVAAYFVPLELLLVWLVLLVAGLALVLPKLGVINRNLHTIEHLNTNIADWFEQQRDLAAKPRNPIARHPLVKFIHDAGALLAAFGFLIYYGPLLLLDYGVKIRASDKVPFIFYIIPSYRIWDILIVVYSFYFSSAGKLISGILLAATQLFVNIALLIHFYRPIKEGKYRGQLALAVFGRTFGISAMLWQGALAVLSFSAIYYWMSKVNPISFSEPLSVLDSIYFSVVTTTTTGYGDILPKSDCAKVICIGEMLFGFCFIIIVLQTMMTLWQREHLPESPDSPATKAGDEAMRKGRCEDQNQPQAGA